MGLAGGQRSSVVDPTRPTFERVPCDLMADRSAARGKTRGGLFREVRSVHHDPGGYHCRSSDLRRRLGVRQARGVWPLPNQDSAEDPVDISSEHLTPHTRWTRSCNRAATRSAIAISSGIGTTERNVYPMCRASPT